MKQIYTELRNKYFTLLIFAAAMGILEAVVVVYLRKKYYPDGFKFPLVIIDPGTTVVELVRELCTLLMLGAISWLSGKSFVQKLAVFLFTFAVWDIFYYIGLKAFLDWPDSIMTWDLLFLIPIVWTGPVLAPVICSLIMIFMAFLFEGVVFRRQSLKLTEFILIVSGALIIYISFTWDIGMLIIRKNYLSSFFKADKNEDFLHELQNYVPDRFQWLIFCTGILIIVFANVLVIRRIQKHKK